jgi:hypothetical protein
LFALQGRIFAVAHHGRPLFSKLLIICARFNKYGHFHAAGKKEEHGITKDEVF